MKILLSLSGGMDSTTLLGSALDQGHTVETVGFTYGSKHNEFENKAAKEIAEYYKVPFRLIDLSGVMEGFRSNLMKSGGNIPEGHYEAENMKLTVVPGRNTIFASILAGLAESVEAQELWLGIHAGDRVIYPDCRPEWLDAISKTVDISTEGKVEVKGPFLYDNKTSIIKKGLGLKVPYRLTRTCYKAQEISCGKCGACRERLSAFKTNGIEDPVLYEYRDSNPDRKND